MRREPAREDEPRTASARRLDARSDGAPVERDAGAAKLAGRDKMIAALQRLARGAEPQLEGSMMAFGINGKRSMSELFMSHPPIEQRIAALRG